MKIGIISINAHTKVLNFASPLHSYAFQAFLEDNGIESTIIDYKPVYYGKFDVRHPLFYYVDHPDNDPVVQARLLKKWKNLFYEREYRFDRFEEFIQKYYKKTDVCYDAKMMETVDAGFDCYICVTDVIWKYNPKNGFDRGYLLACKQMEGKKKIAYAASRGAKGYTADQNKEFFDYISDIDYISVREKSLKEHIEKDSDLPVTHVLDPVFLQEKEFYYDLAIQPEKKGYVLLYIVMEKAKSLVKAAVQFAELHNLEVIELSENKEDENIPKGTHHKVIYDLGVEEWLGYMQNAEYIFTNSFHACCFSIIFGKQFFAGDRSGDKIDSVLEMFKLSSRRISGSSPDMANSMADINYEAIDKLRYEYMQSSKDFILNAIHDMEKKPHENHKNLVHADVYTRKDPKEPITNLFDRWFKKLKKFVKKLINY
ncbi:MAG: polysaccharide pyruvyl transferase family protein [Lachnospiraceae bacterium]|nr:polysaccharide pyruvyl transferase family protein [Lachnospiraceae bacterium]